MAHKEKSCKLNKSSILSTLKINKISCISSDDSSIENVEMRNPVIKFNEKDINRLEIQHHLFRIIWNGNFSVPMQHQLSRGSVNVLEVGSCPLVWTLDMASEYPSSTFIGIENISSITAASYSKLSSYYSSKIPEPRNAAVLQMTSSTPTSLPFPDETFDLVYHKSSLINPSSQSLHNPFNTLNQLLRVLKPGGWLEFMIIEKQWFNLGPITEYVKNSYVEFLSSTGINYIEYSYFERYLTSRKDISCIRKQIKETPIGSFGGRVGEFLGEVLLNPIKHNKHNLCIRMKISEKKFDELINVMIKEINQYKTYCRSIRLYARKQSSARNS
ncbi:hypothetical protein RclHR1_00030068 [Rhizophagus clarus]|uniref:S-adenosyl-L-methionine-dependent methyltransferase n=1 Tax=Rhizophagus clarus TaxID=94130 RepID=A0A2Z6RLD7_9GLOM|nr:hypothetical protein RclHR1_00030068 [Rhizophagus clarus]GES95581.1 S-adenosyl-L-methionine-dependent methyltransferase [Rhizophagus clarus]